MMLPKYPTQDLDDNMRYALKALTCTWMVKDRKKNSKIHKLVD